MRIESQLRRLYPAAAAADPSRRDALEVELSRSYASRRRPRRRWLLGVVLGGVALAGACVVPADYDLAVGHRVLLTLSGDTTDFDPESLARYLEEAYEVDEIRILAQRSVHDGEHGDAESGTDQLTIALDLVGRLDIEAVERGLLEEFPTLADADIDIEALDGTVHGTLGGMLSQRALGLSLDRESIEETRERILADLAARGLDGEATIDIEEEITDDGVRREVKVRVKATAP